MSLLEFYRERIQRRWEAVPRRVLAFYYPWYGTPEYTGRSVHWGQIDPERQDIEASTHYPAIGAYDSHDPELVRRHVRQAREAGIDGFIVSWWGPGDFSDQAMPELLEAAAADDFFITVYWETVPGSGEEQIARAASDLLYLLDRYGEHPAFLRVADRPVVFVYGRVMGQVPMAAWPEILRRVAAERPDTDYLLIADGYTEAYAVAFDGVHIYNPVGWVRDKDPEALRAEARSRYREAVALARRFGKIACVTVIPGYDDTKIRTPGVAADRQEGATYRVLWEEAIAADPDWVLITTWNEWHEGSEIEPSVEHGDRALRQTAEYASRFREGPPEGVRLGDALHRPPEALVARFRDAPIGLLPDFQSSVVFWLLAGGFPLVELDWEAVAQGAVQTDRVPVMLYAGGERFQRTVSQPGDVEAGIRAYLHSGGTLVALGSGPFPFYYDETGEPVVAAERLGLPVRQGWEAPPSGVRLEFRVLEGTLPDLPAVVPFPENGDRRWRPADPALVPDGGVYVPLIRLVDDSGRSYGEGAAAVRFPEGTLAPGRTLYVWMGLPRAFGPELYTALFTWLAEELGR